MPASKDVRYGSAVTMMFCFCSLEIIFINSKFKVVDKVVLRPWVMVYIPKTKAKYIIEAYPGKLENIKVGDEIKIELNLSF